MHSPLISALPVYGSIVPGWIETDLAQTYLENVPDPATALEEIKGLHPAGRAGRPDDIGDVAVFLAAGSDFVTGQTIVVDGGRTARLPMPRT